MHRNWLPEDPFKLLEKAGANITAAELQTLISEGHLLTLTGHQAGPLARGQVRIVMHPLLAAKAFESLSPANRDSIIQMAVKETHLNDFPHLKDALKAGNSSGILEAAEKGLSKGGKEAFDLMLNILKRVH